MKFARIGLVFLVACGGDPFVYVATETPSEGSPDSDTVRQDASDDQKSGLHLDSGLQDSPNRSEAASSSDAQAEPTSDVDDIPDANRSEAATDSSDAGYQAVCCRTLDAVVGCAGGDWSCCTGPLVNCDGSTCGGTCSGVSSLCGSPRCSPGEACLTSDGHEGVVGGCS